MKALEAEDLRLAAKDGRIMGTLMMHAMSERNAVEDATQIEKAAERLKKRLEDAESSRRELEADRDRLRLREQALLNGEGDPAAIKLIMAHDRKVSDLESALTRAHALATTGGSWTDEPESSVEEEPSRVSRRPVRTRRDTGRMFPAATGFESDPPPRLHPAPRIHRPETPLLVELGTFLDELELQANGAPPDRRLVCDEMQSRDLLFLLHNFSVESKLLPGKPVSLRKFAITYEKEYPESKHLLGERLRQKTNPGVQVPVP
jgi:hypothetical protein